MYSLLEAVKCKMHSFRQLMRSQETGKPLECMQRVARVNRILETMAVPEDRQLRVGDAALFSPILIGCSVFALVFAVLFLVTVRSLGHWYYPLDDAYIEMSIAKHLALHGVWGTSSQFASATSSPCFVVLLAIGYRIFGVSQYTALILAFAGCVGAIFVTARLLRFLPLRLQRVGVCLVVVLTPLWTMSVLGMEHALQILLCILFLDLAVQTIALDQRLDWKILLVAALMVSVRYEGLFVAAGACLLLLLRKRWIATITLAFSAWLPVVGFGLYFRLHGAHWLPNSLLLKGGPEYSRIVVFLRDGFHMSALMFVATWFVWRYRHSLTRSRAKAAVGITTTALWLHFFLASYGWVYRYEAYLIALGIVSLLLCYGDGLLKRGLLKMAVVALLFLVAHAVVATITLPGRSRSIYMQQVQTAKLLSIYPASAALNDIGAPTLFTDAQVEDIVGLGSQDIFDARYHHPYTTAALGHILAVHKVKTIAIYDNWFSEHPGADIGGPPLPPGFVRVAKLHTPDPYRNLGGETVSYYATPESQGLLRAALQKLETTLPAGDSIDFEK